MFNTAVSDIQTGVAISGKNITGNLKFLDSGDIADYWGDGHFLALQLSNIDTSATSVKVGLRPTYPNGGTTPVDDDSGLVEIINDPDKNGVFKITNKNTQKFKVVSTDGSTMRTDIYNLSGLTFLYTQSELENMTITEIKAIATERGYTITETSKSAIITEFLAQQNA